VVFTPERQSIIQVRLTAAQFDLARLIIHRILVENHIARQRQRQSLTIEDRAVRRQADETVGHCDGVKQAVLEVAYEDIWRPHAVKLAVVKGNAATVCSFITGKRQSLVTPDLT